MNVPISSDSFIGAISIIFYVLSIIWLTDINVLFSVLHVYIPCGFRRNSILKRSNIAVLSLFVYLVSSVFIQPSHTFLKNAFICI